MPFEVIDENDTLVNLLFLRDAAAVTRYHTQRTLRQQTLAAHQYGVAQLIHYVWPECRKELLLAAMFHDLPEYITGDIPSPAKRNSPQLAILLEEIEKGCGPLYQDFGLTSAEECVLRWCDTFELVLWSNEERILGNQFVVPMLKRGIEWCTSVSAVVPPHVRTVMLDLEERMLINTKDL